MGKKKITSIAVAVFGLALSGYFLLSGARDRPDYYLTVSELLAQGEAAYGKGVRVGGRIVPGSIAWDGATSTLTFQLSDGQATLEVAHKGVAPDNFRDGGEIVVEGMYTPEEVFRAGSLTTKCPSKYEAQAE